MENSRGTATLAAVWRVAERRYGAAIVLQDWSFYVFQSRVGEPSTTVRIGDSTFDVAGVGNWINDNVWLGLLFAAVAFIFYLFKKEGFAEKLLEYRLRVRQIDAKRLDDARALADILRRKYEGDEPRLPFGEDNGEKGQ